ncbi:rod shape-determining protein MreC [Oscillospiraceae bacterium WX1]
MKRFLRIRVLGVLIVAVIIATLTLISVNTNGSPGFLTNSLMSLSKPLKSIASSVAREYENLYGYINQYQKVVAENESLKAELAKLQQDYREYTDVSNENEQLRALLELSARHPDYKQYDMASVISWSVSNWSSSFTISKGSSNSRIKVGDCVITETGDLVGVVSAVSSNSSTVITVLDTTFSVGAYIERNDEHAIATGDFTLMGQDMLKLDYLPDSTDIVTGDTIITSGKGGILPAGLVIGTVQDVSTYDTGIRRYATIKPAADLTSLTNVYLITSFEITGNGE